MEGLEISLLVIGLLTGVVIGYLVAKLTIVKKDDSTTVNELSEAKTQLAIAQEQQQRQVEQIAAMGVELKEEREKSFQLGNQKASITAEHKNLEQKLKEQKQELSELQAKFSVEFKNLANEIFEEKSKKFTEQNKSNIGDLLNPLKERIEKFEEKVEKTSKESLHWNSSLKEQITNLKELNIQITKEAENLTKALKGDSKKQGNWGEMQLETILERAGLQKDVHYYKEKNFKTEDGSNQRLDYIIKLPDDKTLVLDSKVSLTAYSNYFDTDDEIEQGRFLKMHLDSINAHIKTLGERNYQNLYDITQPDYVMMFVANEPALTMALREDINLYERALEKNIVLVSTTTLLATLRTISYIWKQDLQNKNALEIARQAGALYDKFDGFTRDLIKVGGSLKQTKDNYDAAMNKLTEGTGNLIGRIDKLKKLGAKASKQLDQRLLDRSSDG